MGVIPLQGNTLMLFGGYLLKTSFAGGLVGDRASTIPKSQDNCALGLLSTGLVPLQEGAPAQTI